ncbi:MAG: hypothetical protein V1850_01725 [Candidatus Bathyarchaeota archaeon]
MLLKDEKVVPPVAEDSPLKGFLKERSLIMEIDAICYLPRFRQFMVLSTCESFIPSDFMDDENVFPERAAEKGTMYVEAEDKETVKTMGDITFMRVSEVLGVIYTSKSGRTKLRWRSTRGDLGKLTGEASGNSLVNLYASGALDKTYANAEGRKQAISRKEDS